MSRTEQELAELRAAVREWLAANDAFEAALAEDGVSSFMATDFMAAIDTINQAELKLRSLMGGVSDGD